MPMERFSGFSEGQYHFVVYVPTTIFDPKSGKVEVYKKGHIGEKPLTYKEWFELNDMPRWDVPLQCITLSKRDMKSLEKLTAGLLKKLK